MSVELMRPLPLRLDAFADPRIEMRFMGDRELYWTIVREDLRPGGTKGRFMRELIDSETTCVVYAGPAWGGAAAALALTARELGIDCTLFYARRRELTTRQLYAQSMGAELVAVDPGYLTVVRARAREYVAGAAGRQLIHWGAPELEKHIARLASQSVRGLGFTQAWVAAGSGVTLRALARAFYPRPVYGVSVGRELTEKEAYGAAAVYRAPGGFDSASKVVAPFPTCPHYDGKAWELAVRLADGEPLFWNVMGPEI